MKNVKLGLIALASIFGVGSAFTNAHHFNGTTYYAVTDHAGGFTWTTTDPRIANPALSCQTATKAFCTIVTINGYQPQANVTPTSSQATDVTGFKSFIK